MESLDLAIVRPRGPRVKLAGTIFTAHAIDKLRATLEAAAALARRDLARPA